MADKSLEDIAERMRGIDLAFLTTTTEGGALATRPMSNNGDVDYDGDSFYFTSEETRMVSDIDADPTVSLSFTGEDGFWAGVSGKAKLIRDKQAFEDHWVPDLEEWFSDGVDTPGLVLIQVSAERLTYWDGEDQGEITNFSA